jgi:hypothetical protein
MAAEMVTPAKINLMITHALENRKLPVYGDGRHERDWVHVEDCCRALDRLLEGGTPGGIYNIGSRDRLDVLKIADIVVAALGLRGVEYRFTGGDRGWVGDVPRMLLSIDRLTAADSDIAPVIKLVDTTIFNALERRASDIHIETRDQEVAIKYWIDGVLHYAMPPIAKDWHSTIISRIKVMSELDIAERRVPQDGRFRVRYKARLIDFRVSIMPTINSSPTSRETREG